ncbi:hypothetical protein HDA32_002228 [Spinactinospora alkalitolerans]|uniref:Uncharacterized protein n=1 Tax=Spinactinospora alkalitolerans TaxID=687207 RepID=A0A852TT55_9ACTN|nr:hypothetical protein [Spinactinospora alkalitolerans]
MVGPQGGGPGGESAGGLEPSDDEGAVAVEGVDPRFPGVPAVAAVSTWETTSLTTGSSSDSPVVTGMVDVRVGRVAEPVHGIRHPEERSASVLASAFTNAVNPSGFL